MLQFKRQSLLLLVIAAFILILPTTASALSLDIKPPNPVIKIPGLSDFTAPTIDQNAKTCPEIKDNKAAGCLHIPWIGQYLTSLYKFAVLASTILATVVIMIAGFMWLTAGGNVNQIGTAKSYIGGAVMGLLLMLGSYTILNLINPDLVIFKSLRVAVVEKKELPQIKTLEATKSNCAWDGIFDTAAVTSAAITCPAGKSPAENTDCTGQPNITYQAPNEAPACCCQRPTYQPRISEQQADASPELANLIDCLNKTQIITITSISDSNIGSTCEPWRSDEIFNSKTDCQHSRGSDHYGLLNSNPGQKVGFSCAVDLKSQNYAVLKTAARNCRPDSPRIECEDNSGKSYADCSDQNVTHVHASVPGC